MSQIISDILGTLHDGVIYDFEENDGEIKLKIGCLYLAELVNKKYEDFYLILDGVLLFEFITYNEIKYEGSRQVLKNELEIGYSELNNLIVKTSCNFDDDIHGSAWGYLNITANFVKLLDHNEVEIQPQVLYDLSNKYWTDFKNKN